MNVKVNANSSQFTVGVPKDLVLDLSLTKRTPAADFEVVIPAKVKFEEVGVLVNVIGRGEVAIADLSSQSGGRCAVGYEKTVGFGSIKTDEEGNHILSLEKLDLRPDNGIDVQIKIPGAFTEEEGEVLIETFVHCAYEDKTVSCKEQLQLEVGSVISDFHRVVKRDLVYDVNTDYQSAVFAWTRAKGAERIVLLASTDRGENWNEYMTVAGDCEQVTVQGMEPEKEYWFCLQTDKGCNQGRSNVAKVYSSMYNVRTAGKAPVDGSNAADVINQTVSYLHQLGGGTLLLEGGIFSTTTICLQSNVYIYIDKSAQINVLKGCNDNEETWYSDVEYRKSQDHITMGPYITPENWTTKQDAGHTFWKNSLFYAIRQDNIKVIGNGRINGDGNLTKSNMIPELESGTRGNKVLAVKLCTNVEMGGLSVGKDLWYKETDKPDEDQPFYLDEDGNDCGQGTDNMLNVLSGGHFVFLASGTDGVSVHDLYAEKGPQVRDIMDLMQSSDVQIFNIYAEGAPDDIVKLGSDCSLGFTRPAGNYIVRNIVGDTGCNLFQIGSETADDISNVCVDNIYVLAANKAGYSISVNDGGHIKDIHLNCGGSAGCCRHGMKHEGLDIGYKPAKIHPHKSIMKRTRCSIFLSLSCRGRVLGGEAVQKVFVDDIGVTRDEVVCTNVNIGRVDNVFLRYVDVEESYGDSKAQTYPGGRWSGFIGQPRTTPLIVGYKIPDNAGVTLPDGSVSRDITNVVIEEIDMVVKGGNPIEDKENIPRELGVGQFNLRNLSEDERGSKIPSYGYYARHVDGLVIRDCKVDFEENDDRYVIACDDVKNVTIENVEAPESLHNKQKIHII